MLSWAIRHPASRPTRKANNFDRFGLMRSLLAVCAYFVVAAFCPAQVAEQKQLDSSGIKVDALTAVQIASLTTLGKVWGFLKYHHPAVTAGDRDWDRDLFQIMPRILAA